MIPNNTSTIGKLLRLPLKWVPQGRALPIIYGPLRGMHWISGSSDHGCWLGLYEKAKVSSFIKKLKSLRGSPVIYDLGAHVGYYTLLAAKYAPNSKIHSFEPVPENLEFFGRHMKLNQITNVTLHPGVVGEIDSDVMFDFGHSSTTGKVSDRGEKKVHQYCIDKEVREGRLAPPDLIKMDIEGAEFEALRGAQETLGKHHPAIFLATHSSDLHRSCLGMLKDLGYQFGSIDGRELENTDEILAI